MNSFYSEKELMQIGFQSIGNNIMISRKSSIYSPDKIKIGNNVRIDDFCILSGNIEIGNNIHIAAYSALYGGTAGIFLKDFVNISSRVCIYAVSDDFSGRYMTSPLIPEKYKNTINQSVTIERHVVIGTGSTILPGVCIREGSAIGAMSLCKNSTDKWTVYAGSPIKKIYERDKNILALERCYIDDHD